jgi:hypothetical protein
LPNTTLNQKKINNNKKAKQIGYKPFDPDFFLLDMTGLTQNLWFDHKLNQKSWFDQKTNQKQNQSKKKID